MVVSNPSSPLGLVLADGPAYQAAKSPNNLQYSDSDESEHGQKPPPQPGCDYDPGLDAMITPPSSSNDDAGAAASQTGTSKESRSSSSWSERQGASVGMDSGAREQQVK